MWWNGTKCNDMFMFPLKNLARKGLSYFIIFIALAVGDIHLYPSPLAVPFSTPHTPWCIVSPLAVTFSPLSPGVLSSPPGGVWLQWKEGEGEGRDRSWTSDSAAMAQRLAVSQHNTVSAFTGFILSTQNHGTVFMVGDARRTACTN